MFLSVSIATISNFLQKCTLWRHNYGTSQPKIGSRAKTELTSSKCDWTRVWTTSNVDETTLNAFVCMYMCTFTTLIDKADFYLSGIFLPSKDRRLFVRTWLLLSNAIKKPMEFRIGMNRARFFFFGISCYGKTKSYWNVNKLGLSISFKNVLLFGANSRHLS